MLTSRWRSAHLVYHGDLDGLLTDLVAPLVAQLTADGLLQDWFFLRYWDGGPHVRLRLLPAETASARALCEAVTRRSEAFFAERPSQPVLTDEAYRSMAEQLARTERLARYEPTMLPNNTVQWIAYERESARYGTGASMLAVERHFGESSRIALTLLSARMSQRFTWGFLAVVIAWLAAPGERTLLRHWISHNSLRIVGGVTEEQLAERYESKREQLETLARRLADQSSTVDSGTLFAEWATSVRRLCDALAAVPESLPQWETLAHGAVLPVLDLVSHLFCNRLGMSRRDEQYIRYLAARALAGVDEVGHTA